MPAWALRAGRGVEMPPRVPQMQVYRSADGWRWRLRAANGRTLAQGEAHTRRRDALRAAATVVRSAARAAIAPW